MNRLVGVKCYGYDWANVHGLSMAQAAQWLTDSGVDWALVQNQVDPLPGSEVSQQLPVGVYDDLTFRNRLREQGVRFFESTVVFHDPEAYATDPRLRPVDARGRVFEPTGWYVGLCPSDHEYVKRKAEKVAEAAERFRPDGVFLSFIRFPGFWELWMPETARADITEYCFCDRCLHRFQTEGDVTLPGGTRDEQIRVLLRELYPQWTAWKCRTIAEAVRVIRSAVHDVMPGIPVLLNGFGLGAGDFGNAVEEVLAQRFADLDPVVDFYELMFYFQIQRRNPASWIPQRLAEARAQSERPLLACLQAGPEYLTANYGRSGRSAEITDEEWTAALHAASAGGADGVLVYSWRDLLADQVCGGRRVRDLLDYRAGHL